MKEDLLERQAQAEKQFNALVKDKEQKEAELRNLESELNRLQGEYRVLSDLLAKDELAVSPSAEVIDVDAAVKGKKNG